MAWSDWLWIEIDDDRSIAEIRQLWEDMRNLWVGDVVVSFSWTRRRVLEVLDASNMHYRFQVTRTDGSSSEQELSSKDINETAVADIERA